MLLSYLRHKNFAIVYYCPAGCLSHSVSLPCHFEPLKQGSLKKHLSQSQPVAGQSSAIMTALTNTASSSSLIARMRSALVIGLSFQLVGCLSSPNVQARHTSVTADFPSRHAELAQVSQILSIIIPLSAVGAGAIKLVSNVLFLHPLHPKTPHHRSNQSRPKLL